MKQWHFVWLQIPHDWRNAGRSLTQQLAGQVSRAGSLATNVGPFQGQVAVLWDGRPTPHSLWISLGWYRQCSVTFNRGEAAHAKPKCSFMSQLRVPQKHPKVPILVEDATTMTYRQRCLPKSKGINPTESRLQIRGDISVGFYTMNRWKMLETTAISGQTLCTSVHWPSKKKPSDFDQGSSQVADQDLRDLEAG